MASSFALLAQSYFIQGPENPKPYETTAIKELTDYLAKRIDGKLIIGGKSPITFMVGDTELAKSEKCLSTELEDERWVIKSVGDKVLLNGGGTRGALYATYHFLEDVCDIHWWSDYEEYVPVASPMEIAALNLSGKPMFLYRDIYRSHKPENSFITAVRNRLNRDGEAAIPVAYGGSFTYGNPAHCHTYDRYLPFSKYGKEHPEWYSLVNGKRVGGQFEGQLCLSNPELRQTLLTKVLETIANDKGFAKAHGYSEPRIYEVSMNDNQNRCQCDACKAEEDKYNPSGFTLNLVNWIAAEVAKKHPGLYVSTLAYFYNEPPPKGGVRAADNVIVKLCDTRTNQAASILEPDNKVFLDFLTQWKADAKNLFIWDYAIVFKPYTTGLPFASELHYGDLYRTYYENNVSGVFWEHERPHLDDFHELKYFVETKLFENPYQDVTKLITIFMTRYYGDASELLMQYRRRVDEERRKNRGYVSWMPSVADFAYITDADIVEFQQLFDKAEALVANDSTRLARVRHARAGLDRYNCHRRSVIVTHGMGRKHSEIDTKAAYERLKNTWKSWIDGWAPKHQKDMIAEMDAELELFGLSTIRPASVPKGLENEAFYDIYAPQLQSRNVENVMLVDDAESAVGKAMRSNADLSDYYSLPFEIGVYDTRYKKTTAKKFPKPFGKGYNWYSLGTNVVFPNNGYLYMTRSWTTQWETAPIELRGKPFEIRVSAKFTGPKFFPDEQGKSYIYIDRVLFIVHSPK